MWLASGLGWGAVNSGELLRLYPDGAQQILEELGSDAMDELLTQKQAERLAGTRPQDYALPIAHAETQGIIIVAYDDEAYPAALRTIHNPPPVLFVKGDVGLLNGQLTIGMVGTRRPSAYGMEAMKAIGRGVALGGAIIVSGLAAGLDSEAHKAALAVNGPTIACIGFGHNHCYPAANRKLMEVIERSGVVISEYPPETQPEKPYFLQRNRLIAGMCHGLVVVEARRQSGTMSTVNFATEFARDVFAVPGSIFSDLSGGTNSMISEGAYLAASAADVLAVYGVEWKGEDPVRLQASDRDELLNQQVQQAAEEQARQGRPQQMSAAAPWQVSVKRHMERKREERIATVNGGGYDYVQPDQHSLGELLRTHLKNSDQQVSALQAIDAFKHMQQDLPPTSAAVATQRDRALDEMVVAVSDSVEISKGSRIDTRQRMVEERTTEVDDEGRVKSFSWERLERLDKRQVEDLSPIEEVEEPAKPGRRQAVPSRVHRDGEEPAVARQGARTSPRQQPPLTLQQAAELPQLEEDRWAAERAERPSRYPDTEMPPPREERAERQPATPVRRSARPSRPSTAPIEPVGRVAAVEAVQPASTVSATGRAEAAAAAPQPMVFTQEHTQPPMVPAADRPLEKPLPDDTLTERLQGIRSPKRTPSRSRTVPTQAAASREEMPARGKPSEAPLAEPGLSEKASRALKELGATPMSLSALCEKSGLSSGEAMAALTELELAGLSRQLAGRQFVAV